MLPGTQSNFISVQVSCDVYRAAQLPALQMYRNAAVLELADRYVGELSESLAARLNLPSTVRRVLISADSQRHAIERRAVSSQIDAELVAARIADAFSNIRYLRLPQREERVYELVGLSQAADRWLLMPLKLVLADPLSRESDGLWIRTAHPFGKKNMRRAIAKGLLLDLFAESAS